MPSPGDHLPNGHRLVRRMATAGGWLVVHPHAPHVPWIVLEPRDPLPNRALGDEPDAQVRWIDDRPAPAWRLDGAMLLAECVGPMPSQRFSALEEDLGAHAGPLSSEHLLWRPGALRVLPGAFTWPTLREADLEDLLDWLRPGIDGMAGACHAGQMRGSNADHLAWWGEGDWRLAVVADGTGGYWDTPRYARSLTTALWAELSRPPADGDEAEAKLRAGYDAALRAVAELEGGATVLAAFVGPNEARILHIGDVMAWRWRRGELTRLVTPHTLVQRLVQQGRITEAEALRHRNRNIFLRCLTRVKPGGSDADVVPDLHRVPLEPGDRLLIATDGLYDPLGEPRLVELFTRGSPSQAAHALLLAAAVEGTPDNLAFVVIDV